MTNRMLLKKDLGHSLLKLFSGRFALLSKYRVP